MMSYIARSKELGKLDVEVEYDRIRVLLWSFYLKVMDMMLGAYMDDLGLQPEHLEAALSQIQPSVRSAALQVVHISSVAYTVEP